MYFLLLLFILTSLIALAAASVWAKTRSVGFLVGIGFLYFWSLYGGWSIVIDRLGGDSGMHYHYLLERLFTVYLDNDYAKTLILYAVFILVVCLTVYLTVKPKPLGGSDAGPLVLNHSVILILCSIAGFCSYMLIYDSLAQAAINHASAYRVTRATNDIGVFRIHQIFNRLAIVPAAIGIAVLFSGVKGRYLVARSNVYHVLGYAVLTIAIFVFCIVLGNKNELALALFSGIFFYLANDRQPRVLRLAGIGVALLSCVGFIDFARGLDITDLVSGFSFRELAVSFERLVNSNEAFGAHLSMYGALAYDIPITYGSSIKSFACSVVPRILWPDRPPDIYVHYASSIAAVEGQGYSIHHATGWYLNFGVGGVLMGAMLLGRIWAALYNNLLYGVSNLSWSPNWRLFAAIGFATFTASIPNIVRAGPEGYKSVLIDSFACPLIILAIARVRNTSNVWSHAISGSRIGPARILSR